MKPLPSFARNDVIRAVALISVVAFPLIADAQLGLAPKAVEISKDVSPLAGATAAAIVGRDSCADQHWPFLSKGCLRGSVQVAEPRLVSMKAEPPVHSIVANDPVIATDIGRGNAPLAKPKKSVKPRVATQRRERSTISASYAVNSEMGHMSLAGW